MNNKEKHDKYWQNIETNNEKTMKKMNNMKNKEDNETQSWKVKKQTWKNNDRWRKHNGTNNET